MTREFYKRLGVETSLRDAQSRFVRRALLTLLADDSPISRQKQARIRVAYELGVPPAQLEVMVGDSDVFPEESFRSCLQAIEAMYDWLVNSKYPADDLEAFEALVFQLLDVAEIDLGLTWRNGRFHAAGAKSLDKQLVTDVLDWLEGAGWGSVPEPYRKGLRHLLEARKHPEKLSDVVTDMFEALEAAARLVTGNNNNLGRNRDAFLGQLSALSLRPLLDEYMKYAHEFRHAAKLGQGRKPPDDADAESLVYLTGVFLRRVKRWHRARAG